MKRRIPVLVAAVVLLTTLSTPSAGAAPAQPDLLEEEVLATGESNEPATDGVVVKVNRLERSPGGLAVLAWTLHNQGTQPAALSSQLIGRTYLYDDAPFSGITLLEPEGQIRHHPLMDSTTSCICSRGTGQPRGFVETVGADRYATYYATYLLPEEVSSLTVEIPGFEPMEDVPVS